MATNLRLSPDVAEAVQREAARVGRSQQDVIREALRRYLGMSAGAGVSGDLGELVSVGVVRPPRTVYRKVARRLTLPPAITTADLLDRDDRI